MSQLVRYVALGHLKFSTMFQSGDDRVWASIFSFSVVCYRRSSYQVLIPHLVFLDDFEQVKSISRCLERDWKDLLADCFPKIMVNILPYFAVCGQDALVAQQREKAHRVYDLLEDSRYLGKQVSVLDLSLSYLSPMFVCIC